ncbi:pathogen-associated molecular patterns-induced protein A70 [Punica granatum]|uniref:DUF4408 domain-containing protein n=2 Tax=Punica granatum TaxID=22663 RepID=A0A218VU23_PUNGR|nr:pathogen-associated molecular patterns-induced protein A70 [Punica granatum]OWM63412.1 hypothetical protein CDL15_Pgr022157 [Punica granatum]PKI70702.1 hypothetical protein CRG98_008935 [Punica granatum]
MLEESVSLVPSVWATMNSWFTPTVLFVFLNLMIATIALTSSLNKPNHPEEENPQQEQEIPLNLQRSPSVLQRLKSINFYSPRSPPTETHYADDSYGSAPLQETVHENGEEKPKPFFARSPSIVLQRLRSFSLYSGNSSPEPAAPSPPTSDRNRNRSLEKPLARRTHLSFEDAREEEEAREQGFRAGAGKEAEEEPEEGEELEGHDQFEERSSFDEIYGQLKGNQVLRTESDMKPASGEIPTKLAKKMKKSASAKSAFAHFEEDDIVERVRPFSAREGKAKVSDDDEEEGEGEVDAKADDFINRFKQQLKLQRIDSITRYKDMVNRGSSR